MADAADALAKEIQEYPPLPEAMPERTRRAASGKAVLPDGCYFLAYGVGGLASHKGTMRIESRSGPLFTSGDLYSFESGIDELPPSIGEIASPGPGIPIFPVANYSYYLRVTNIEPAEPGFDLTFEAHRYTANPVWTFDGNRLPHWAIDGSFTARMMPAAAPPGYPSPELFFVGDVSTPPGGLSIGQMQIGWVSPVLRKATIEIDRVPESEVPRDNGAEVSWKSIFDGIGWDLTTVVSNDDVKKDVEKYGDPRWDEHEAHAALLARRDRSDLDAEWRYHILVVQLIDYPKGERGVMYDFAGSNGLPREGLLLSSHFVFPTNEARWGALRGVRSGTTVAFFRTAVHEMGHAMSLHHNSTGFCLMRPTDGIADDAPADMPFPTNIGWTFAPEDEHRLRHWPDIVIRPGGSGFDVANASPLVSA